MYFTFLFWLLAITGFFTGRLFILWVVCSILSCTIWASLYYKSISDYAYLAAERWRMLILFDEVRNKGFDSVMEQNYYFLGGMRAHWIIIASYIRRLHLYSTCQKSWFTRQWISKMPSDLELSILELEAQRNAFSSAGVDHILDINPSPAYSRERE